MLFEVCATMLLYCVWSVTRAHSCLTLCNQLIRLLCPWDSPGKNTGVGCSFLLQEIFPTQGWNLHLLHWQVNTFTTEPPGKPRFTAWLLWNTTCETQTLNGIQSITSDPILYAFFFKFEFYLKENRNSILVGGLSYSYLRSTNGFDQERSR